MKKNKWMASISLSIAMLMSFNSGAYALDNGAKLNLITAVDTAVNQNTNLEIIQDKIKLAERNLRLAIANVDFYKKADWNSGAERQSNAREAYLAPIQKQNEVNALKREYDSALNVLKLKATEEYYSVVKLEKDLASKKSQYAILEKQVAKVKSEYNLGKVTQLDVTKQENDLFEVKNGISNIENDLLIARFNLNATMNEPIENTYVYDQSIPSAEKYTISDLNAVIKAQKSAHADVLAAKENVVALEKEIEVVANYSTSHIDNDSSASNDTSELEIQLKTSKHKATLTELQLEYQIRSDYNNLLNQYDSIRIAQINLTLAEKKLAVTQSKWNVGLVTAIDYQNAVNEKETAETALVQKQIDYYLAVVKFKSNYKL